jgi:hypothetical protein
MEPNKKAVDFYDIQDAVAFNIPVDEKNPFYVDLTPYRSDFTEKKIFKQLNINPNNNKCNPLRSSKKIFLSGYRGTGKTSELLTLTQRIDNTNCYLTIFVDISEEELDTSNIETVDILILMLKKMIDLLEERGADVSSESITDFYDWYKSKIVNEVNNSVKGSAQIEVGVKGDISLLGLIGLVGNTQAKLQGSKESKTVIRREINNNFSMFSSKVNEFILSLKAQLREKGYYQDILFILDGFEKIGSLEDRKKILVDDANKLNMIDAHMIVTLPIELFTEKNRLSHFSTNENFPLIDLTKDGATECFKTFILKRVDEKLFEKGSVEKIIEFGAGHPRQTLQIINRAYVESDDEFISIESVEKAITILASEMSKVNDEEIEVLKKIEKRDIVPESDVYTKLKAKNIIFEYNNSFDSTVINPIVLADRDFQKYLEQ